MTKAPLESTLWHYIRLILVILVAIVIAVIKTQAINVLIGKVCGENQIPSSIPILPKRVNVSQRWFSVKKNCVLSSTTCRKCQNAWLFQNNGFRSVACHLNLKFRKEISLNRNTNLTCRRSLAHQPSVLKSNTNQAKGWHTHSSIYL